jgi:hypothetical protein
VLDSDGLSAPLWAAVSERERPDTDTDIEFDFFEDSPTREAPAEEQPPRRRPRVPRRPPTGAGSSGLLRLALLIAGAILIAVLLVLWVNSCREDQKRSEYSSYMDDVSPIASESAQVGKNFEKLLTAPGGTLTDMQTGLQGLEQQSAQLVSRAQKLTPPGPLRDQQQSLVEALQFRVSGLGGLAQAFGSYDETQDPAAEGNVLQEQSLRLVTSDVVYEDLFKAGSEAVLKQQGISGVAVPDSTFVPAGNEDLVSAKSWTLLLQRLTGATGGGATGTGLRGSALESVSVPTSNGKQALSTTQENTVQASDQLAFEVVVRNSGDVQLTQLPVNFTLQVSPQPVKKTQTIDLLNPGETKTVTFKDIDVAGSFGQLVTLKISVEPVKGENNTTNNSAEYKVIFTVG